MKTTTRPIKPKLVSADVETSMAFAFDGQTGLPLQEAKAKLDAFLASHPLRVLRKGQKGTAELVNETRKRS